MAQPSGPYTPIQLYYSATATNTPTPANMAYGELAINIADGKLYYKNASNAITLIASTAAASLTLPISVSNGGTGQTSLTSGALLKGNGTSAVTYAVSGADYAPPTSGTSLLYANGAGGFSNVPSPVNGYVLSWNGSTYQWIVGVPSGTAANIAGGTAGQVVYQSASSTTAFSSVGNSGQTFVSGATSAPTWIDPDQGTIGLDLTNLNGGLSTTSVWNPISFNCGGAT